MNLRTSIDFKYALFIAFVFLLLILDLGAYSLAETSEARYAEIAREMYLSHDYLNPTLLGVLHFHKPPITYYLTSLGYELFGINEFGARFFMQLAVVIQLIMVYLLANILLKNKKLSFTAGLIYFSMPLVLISSRNLTTDAYLTTFILAALTSWHYYTSRKKVIYLYVSYLMVGIALLTKGPVALLFILTYIIIYKILLKSGSKINKHHILGLILCVGVGASWYLLVVYKNPKLWNYFVHKQILSRINADSFDRSKPFWYYVPIVFGLLLPWLVGLIPDFKKKLQSVFGIKKEMQLLLITSLILFLLFSVFTTKLIMYILPAFWMLAIFIAYALYNASLKTCTAIEITYFILLGSLMTGIPLCYHFQFEFLHVTRKTAFISFFSTLSAFALFYSLKNFQSLRTLVLAACFGIVLISTSTGVLEHNNEAINAMRDEVSFIRAESKGSKPNIIVYDYLLSSIPFYIGANQITLKDSHNTADREVQFQNDQEWKKKLWDVHDPKIITDLKILTKEKNTFLLIRKKHGLSKELSFLKKAFSSKKSSAKWIILYNSKKA